MLQKSQGALDDDVLENGSRGNVDGAALCRDNNDSTLEGDASAQIYRAGDGEVVQLEDLRDAGDVLLEVGNLLEVSTEFDEWRRAKAVRVDLQLAVFQRVQVRLDQQEVGAGLDG